jgi:hypothetical protein
MFNFLPSRCGTHENSLLFVFKSNRPTPDPSPLSMAATTPANLLGDFQLMNCLFIILPPLIFLPYYVYLHLIFNAQTDTKLIPTSAMVVTQVPESSITSSPLTKRHLFVELPYDI